MVEAADRSQAIKALDVVVTPQGRRAMVLRVKDGFADLRFLSSGGLDRYLTLSVRLLRKVQLGRALPPPVRIVGGG